MQTVSINAQKEWQVIFDEGTHWRIGIYRPKLRSAAEITELEQHTCPEAFLLLEGNLVMVSKNKEGSITETRLEPMQMVVFEEPHAGYSPDGSGVAYVVENAKFETQYTDLKSGEALRTVKVGA